MTGFELNEQVKDYCVQLGAKAALTQFFKNGVPIIPDPFYETIIAFDKNVSADIVTECYKKVLTVKDIFDKYYFFTDPLVERNEITGTIQIVYAIFLDGLPFNTEIKVCPENLK
jgi:hypothetical protein